jgi:hypothetical protein
MAFALRATGIQAVPPGLSGDEAINGSDAFNVWRWGQTPIFFTNNYGREAGFLYLMALAIHLIGPNVLAIRLPAVFCGLGGLVLSYTLLRRLWNSRVALIGVALMGVSLWPIFESRVGLRAISMVPLQALALYALWRGLISPRGARPSAWLWWSVFGVCLGLLPYTYIPGRIFPAVVVVWIAAMALLSPPGKVGSMHSNPSGGTLPRDWRETLPGLLAATLLAVAIFAPFGWFILQHPEQANQRVNELSWLLDSARAGNVRPLLENAVETLKMFTVRGDEYWRYNVADRPVFDWATGAFFYLGIALSFARIRQPRHQLILIWTAIMLAPSALAAGTPSFLRSTGAMIPIYAAPAVAADAVGTWLSRSARKRLAYRPRAPGPEAGEARAEDAVQSRRRRHSPDRWGAIYYACLAIGLLAIAAREGVAYFVVWPNTPRVREIYTAGLAQVGQHLNALTDTPSPPTVLVGADFATDYARDMVAFQTRYAGPIRWLIGRQALVVPDRVKTPGELIYLFADAEPPGELAAAILGKAETVAYTTASDGRFESSAYRLLPEARSASPRQPQVALGGRFEGAMELIGYDLPPTVLRGESVSLIVTWRVPDRFKVDRVAPLWFSVALSDDEDNIWDQRSNLLPYPSWEWHPGDWVIQQITLPIAVDLPPGELSIAFSIQRDQVPLRYTTADGAVMSSVPMGPLAATGHPVAPVKEGAVALGAAGEIALEATLMVGVAKPGDALRTVLFWRAIAEAGVDYAVRLTLLPPDCIGEPVHAITLPLGEKGYPTSQWIPGEAVRSFHHPTLPRDLPTGHYGVAVSLVAPGAEGASGPARDACLPLEITGYIQQFTIPEMDVRVDRALSDGITLLGYAIEPAPETLRPGDPFTLTLIWQADREPSNAYTVFAHLYGPDGQIVTQHDGTPCDGKCPAHSWLSGEIVTDPHPLTLPEDLASRPASGGFTIGVGMYDLPTLVRLTIPDAVDDVLLLPWPAEP